MPVNAQNTTHKSTPDQLPGKNFGMGGMHRFAPGAKAKDRRGTILKLFNLYKKESKILIAVFFMLIGSSIVALSVPTLISKAVDMIDGVETGKAADLTYIKLIGFIILFSYLFDWLMSTLQGWSMTGASQKIVRLLRENMFNKIQNLPLGYHDATGHGEIMSRLTNDVDNISGTIAASTSQLMSAAISVIGSFVFMLILSPLLTLITLITTPPVIFMTKGIAKRSKALFIGQQKDLGRINGLIEETISGLRMVKAFNRESATLETFDEINDSLLKNSTGAQIISGFLMPMLNVINNLGISLVAGFGGLLAINGLINIGIIAGFVTYTRQFIRPLNEIAGTFNTLQSALAGAERVFEILGEEEEKHDSPDSIALYNPRGCVRFTNVCFGYNLETPILKNISFHVGKGETVAFVGETGAGKTTIINLLTRFYDPTSGFISIDGRDITQYTRQSLRRAFSTVLQDTGLFTGTILDNIRYGKPDATRDEIIQAAIDANADPFIRRLRNGYDTVISGTVDSLSQGQRQLIAIARAALCTAPILIMDEATSCVDTATEMKIQQAMLKLLNNRTTFLIAHRLSTIKNADMIFVINNGEIIESGTHMELMSLRGKYAEMYHYV